MRQDQKRRELQKEGQRSKRPSTAPSMSSKTIRKGSGDVVRQYPAEVGYHGSGDETKLSPEE